MHPKTTAIMVSPLVTIDWAIVEALEDPVEKRASKMVAGEI